MRVPSFLFLSSLSAALFGYGLTGSWDSGPVMLALLSALAALILLVRSSAAPPVARPKRPIVVDGSNIMHWKSNVPQLDTLQEVITVLQAQGFQPGVVFDATAGHKLVGKYLDDAHLACALGLPPDRVLVVPRGTSADPVILQVARELNASILTNDRFRDWAPDHPEIAKPGHLLRGGYRNGALWLESLPSAPAA
ncbi:MAG: NYN domain-containing protein [Paracoccaceae bacterium]